MFTALDPTTLAYGRREEMAREVSSARLENRSRATRGGPPRRTMVPADDQDAPGAGERERQGGAGRPCVGDDWR